MKFASNMAIVAITLFVGAVLGGLVGGLLAFFSKSKSDPMGFLETAFLSVPLFALLGGIASLFVLYFVTKPPQSDDNERY